MAEDEPNGGEEFPNPFASLPIFGDMMRAMSRQGPLNWDLASQFAVLGAAGDTSDPAPEPSVRIAYDALADIADMHVSEVSGLPTGPGGKHPEILTVSRAEWAQRTLTDLRPLFTDLAASLAARNSPEAENTDPFGAMLSNLSSMMAPSMMGIAIGSMIGALARRALGQYELPLARPGSSDILVVASSVDSFASEWDIVRDDLRMWVLVHELSSHAVLASPGVREGLSPLIVRHVAAFKPDPTAIVDRMGNIDPTDADAMAHLQRMFSDPMVILGAVRSDEQEEIAPLLDARLAAVSGYVDLVVDSVAARLLGGASRIAEAVRRRRADYGTDAQLVERLLGINVTRASQIRGRAFVDGVVERAGAGMLARMVEKPVNLPTPSEVDAPGLWLARLDLDADSSE